MSLVTKHSKVNPLFSRRQLHLLHLLSPETISNSPDTLSLIASKFKTDSRLIVIHDSQNSFGGLSKQYHVHIYDDLPSLLKYEPIYELARLKIVPKKPNIRKVTRLQKQREAKLQGTEKVNKKSGMRVEHDYDSIMKRYFESNMGLLE